MSLVHIGLGVRLSASSLLRSHCQHRVACLNPPYTTLQSGIPAQRDAKANDGGALHGFSEWWLRPLRQRGVGPGIAFELIVNHGEASG